MQSAHNEINVREIGHRLNKYLMSQRKSINSSSKELSMHPSQVYNIIKGKNYGVTYLLRILQYYPDINPLWLITGEGHMLKSEELTKDKFKLIPVFDITVTAGRSLSFFEDKEAVIDHISIGIEFKDCNAAIRIYGDSMYPLYQSGDLILIKSLKKHSYIQWGHAYLIITKEDRMLKHVHKGPAEDTFILKSHNEHYHPFEIQREDILGIFEVHGYIRKLKM